MTATARREVVPTSSGKTSLKNAKAKGTRHEDRIRLLEEAGHRCTRAALTQGMGHYRHRQRPDGSSTVAAKIELFIPASHFRTRGEELEPNGVYLIGHVTAGIAIARNDPKTGLFDNVLNNRFRPEILPLPLFREKVMAGDAKRPSDPERLLHALHGQCLGPFDIHFKEINSLDSVLPDEFVQGNARHRYRIRLSPCDSVRPPLRSGIDCNALVLIVDRQM
jgi:hypothetical protein